MPVHDWTLVDAGLFHAFHQRWISALCDALNGGGLPADYFALAEQSIHVPNPAVQHSEANIYAARADHILVRHRQVDVVAVVKIVSPGNKSSRAEFQAIVQKSVALLRQKVHLLVVDLFPPGKRDPQGIHKAIWDEIEEEDFAMSPQKRLTVAAYDAGPPQVAYVEPIAVGDVLPEAPLFLQPGFYVPAPLEASYAATWSVFPAAVKGLLEK